MDEARGATETDGLLKVSTSHVTMEGATSSEGAGGIPKSPHHRKANSEIPTGSTRRHVARHRKNMSSLGQAFEQMSKSLGVISEGLESEVENLRETWQRELQDADRGKTFFLDMTLTRSLSVLPEEIDDLVNEVANRPASFAEIPSRPPELDGQAKESPWGPYIGLMSAVVAVSSNGTALSLLTGVSPPLKYFWRMSAVAILLSYFAVSQLVKTGGLPSFTPSRWITMAGAVICFVGHALGFVTALQYTSIGNAIIGANSQAILLVLGKALIGTQIHWMEAAGVAVAFIGCIMCSADEARDVVEEEGKNPWKAVMGDSIAFCGGLFGVGYLTFAKAVRSELPVTVFMFLVMSCGSVLVLLYMLMIGTPMELSTDPQKGLFGWMTLEDGHIWVLLYIALVCNLVGTMGFVRAMHYFETLVIAVATLLEPLVATLIAFFVLGSDLPGPVGWVGNLLVVLGTLGVIYPSANKPLDH